MSDPHDELERIRAWRRISRPGPSRWSEHVGRYCLLGRSRSDWRELDLDELGSSMSGKTADCRVQQTGFHLPFPGNSSSAP